MTYLAEGDGPDFKPGERAEHIAPVVTVFHGRPKVFYLAVCVDCGDSPASRPVPMPFGTESARDAWADGHRTTGHNVVEALEVRP